MLVMHEELQYLPQGIIFALQFNIEAILDRTYCRDDMILAAFDIADELRAFVDHNLRGFAHNIRVRVDANGLHDEIETVLFRLTLSIQERPILALGFHFLAADRGDTFLHKFRFLNTPGLVDFGGVHRHTVRTCANHIERPVLFGGANIQITCQRESFAFTVFGHFREEARELDVIASYVVLFEYFVDLDVSKILAVGLVFELEVFRCDISYLAAVGDALDFKLVFLVGELLVGDVDWDA